MLLGLKKASPWLKDSCVYPLSQHTHPIRTEFITTDCLFVCFHWRTEYKGVCAKGEGEEGRKIELSHEQWSEEMVFKGLSGLEGAGWG